MKYKKFIVFLISVILLTIGTSSATATTNAEETPDPMSRVGEIVEFERVTDVTLLTDVPSPDGAGGCKIYTKGVNGYSAAGIHIWSYAWNVNWCYDGTSITSLSKWRTVWTNYGWGFEGDIAENESGGIGQSSYWHYAQGDFCFIETYTCVAHSYPWVSQTVYGSGAYTGSGGGN